MSKNHGFYAGEPMVNFQNRMNRVNGNKLNSTELSKLVLKLKQLKEELSLSEFRKSEEFHELLKQDYGYFGEKLQNLISRETSKLSPLVRDESKLTEYWWKYLEGSIVNYSPTGDFSSFKVTCMRRAKWTCMSQKSIKRAQIELPIIGNLDEADQYMKIDSNSKELELICDEVSERMINIQKIMNKPKQQFLFRLFTKVYLEEKVSLEDELYKSIKYQKKSVQGVRSIGISSKYNQLKNTILKQYNFPVEAKIPKFKSNYSRKVPLSKITTLFGAEFGGSFEANKKYIVRFRNQLQKLMRVTPNTSYGDIKDKFYNEITHQKNKDRKSKYESFKNQPVKTYNVNDLNLAN